MNGYDPAFVHFFVWIIHILWQQQKVAQFLWLQTYPMFLEQYTESQIGMESKTWEDQTVCWVSKKSHKHLI